MFSIKKDRVKPPPCVVDTRQVVGWFEDGKVPTLSSDQGNGE